MLADVTRPSIPASVKREVRQRCGFGCVICGLPLYEYEHMTPFAEVGVHDPENLVLLCPNHHAEKTKGHRPVDTIREANENPHNIREGESSPYGLHFPKEDRTKTFVVELGSTEFRFPLVAMGLLVPILVDDTPLLSFKVEEGRLLVSMQLFNRSNELLVQVVENELIYSVDSWDVEYIGNTLTVRHGLGDIFVRLEFDPEADKIIINSGRIWRNGVEVVLGPTGLSGGNFTISEIAFQMCEGILAIGDCPPIDAPFLLPNPKRVGFIPWPGVETRVRRVRARQPDDPWHTDEAA
jgi:hypothetical protein